VFGGRGGGEKRRGEKGGDITRPGRRKGRIKLGPASSMRLWHFGGKQEARNPGEKAGERRKKEEGRGMPHLFSRLSEKRIQGQSIRFTIPAARERSSRHCRYRASQNKKEGEKKRKRTIPGSDIRGISAKH